METARSRTIAALARTAGVPEDVIATPAVAEYLDAMAAALDAIPPIEGTNPPRTFDPAWTEEAGE